MAKRPCCYYCNRFISFEMAFKNWKLIQAPGVMDPEPFEIMWCDGCGSDGEARQQAARTGEG